jgi:hypothetical protein
MNIDLRSIESRVRALCSRYGDAVDRGDVDVLIDCFVADGELRGTQTYRGHDALRRLVEGADAGTRHATFDVHVHATRSDVVCSTAAFVVLRPQSNGWHVVVRQGLYDDTSVISADGELRLRRRVVIDSREER